MKKVLQIPNYQYPHIGGIEQTARDIANVLKENAEIEQKIICFNEDAQDGDYQCYRGDTVHDLVDDVEVIRCGCFAKVASQSLSLTYPFELKKIFDNFKPDVVVLHFPNPFVSSFLLKMMPKDVRFILYWHSDIVKQEWLVKLFDSQTEKLLSRADTIVVTSPNYIEGSAYLRQYKDKCIVIPSCIKIDRFVIDEETETIAKSIKEKYKNKTICFAIGRHIPYKGMEYFVKASKLLNDDFAILIGGDGELTNTLKEMAKGDSKVEFLGRVDDKTLAAYYLVCDIFAFPSITKNEAFGLSLAEAMYFENPAVTFTILGSGVNYVSLDKVTGIECPNRDVNAFAEAFLQLQQDESLRKQYGKTAKKRVEDNFLFDNFSKHIKELI